MNWNHIVQCIRHEISAAMSASMAAAVQSMKMNDLISSKNDLSEETLEQVLLSMQMRGSLSNKEIAYIRGAVKRAREYKWNRDEDGMCLSRFI